MLPGWSLLVCKGHLSQGGGAPAARARPASSERCGVEVRGRRGAVDHGVPGGGPLRRLRGPSRHPATRPTPSPSPSGPKHTSPRGPPRTILEAIPGENTSHARGARRAPAAPPRAPARLAGRGARPRRSQLVKESNTVARAPLGVSGKARGSSQRRQARPRAAVAGGRCLHMLSGAAGALPTGRSMRQPSGVRTRSTGPTRVET